MKDHKLAAIVFTDIVGYTRRMAADEEGTMKLLARQREILFPIVKEFGGEVIKEIGDGLMMMFTSANRAVRFAMKIQELLKDDELTIRAGIHIGDVIFEDKDVFGSAVNIAARIEPLAPAGGICISEDVRSQIRNQKDIFTVSIGKKELKGVSEPLEIYQVVAEGNEGAIESVPFFKDLWKRRVFQITALYVVLSFLVRLLMDFLVGEFMWSPHLVNLSWFILLSLVPSIILLAYFHGRREVSRWTRVELIGMPLNVLLTVFIMFFVFKGKDLGAMTTTLTVQNEEGENIEKVVIKNEFRKRIILFNFKNISDDASLNYLQYGIPTMLRYDLSQDLLLTPETTLLDDSDFINAGYEDAVGMPITLMKRYAEKKHFPYFLVGEYSLENGGYSVQAILYDTKTMKVLEKISLQNTDIFTLMDELTVSLKYGLKVPESHIEETIDLPIAEIFTSNEKALVYFSKSMRENATNNYARMSELLENAINEDPDFASAYLSLILAYFNEGNIEKTKSALNNAMGLLYKVPERLQFIVKYVDYVIGQKPEKALAILEMWVDLYPDDMTAHSTLALRYKVKGMVQEAIGQYHEMLRLDPEQYELLESLGDEYLQIGEYDSALFYYEQYAERFPQESKSYDNLGDFYSTTGEFGLAKEKYEKAVLLAGPYERVNAKLELADLLLITGQFDDSYSQGEEALTNAKTSNDSIKVYNFFMEYFLAKGQVQKSFEWYEMKNKKYASILPPKDFMALQILTIQPFVNAGKIEEAFELLEELDKKLEPPLNNLIPFGYLTIYAETGETEKATEAVSGAVSLIDGFGEEMLMANIYYSQGKISEHLGEYQKAIESYNKYLEMQPTSHFVYTNIARCYRLMKEFKKAEQSIELSLKQRPFSANNHYEAALLYFDMNKNEKGIEHLQKSLEIWQDADPDYEKANLAKEKMKSVG